MERRKFIKACCCSSIGLTAATFLQSCSAIYYATTTSENNVITLPKSEFTYTNKKEELIERTFVLVNTEGTKFPICVYHLPKGNYTASLLKCTHRGCELNVGGGIFSCPCHGSEFSTGGEVLEGPAERKLQTYSIETNNENIYIKLA